MPWSSIASHSLKTRITLSVLAIFVIGIWSFMTYISKTLRDDMERMLGEQQLATVTLVVADLNRELEGRLNALQAVAQGITSVHISQPSELRALLQASPVLQTLFNDGVAFAGLNGTVLADFPQVQGRVGANFAERDYFLGPVQTGNATIGKPVRSKLTQHPTFVMAVPAKDAQGKVIGVLAGVIDLGKSNFLDQITGNHYGLTGGYSILARNHRLIVTATDPRSIMTELAQVGQFPWLDQVTQGFEGTRIAVDPSGVEVLNSIKALACVDWVMIAALPTTEAFAPWQAMQRRMLIATLLLTLFAGGLIWWLLVRQLSPMLAAARKMTILSKSEQWPAPLPVHYQDEVGDMISAFNRLLVALGQREKAIQKSEELYRNVTNQGQALIWLAGPDKGCDYFNQPWLDFTGRTLQQELGSGWTQGVHPDDLSVCFDTYQEAFDRRESFSMTYRLRRRDGQYRWILDDGAPRFDSQNEFVGYVGHCLDITERKLGEDINTFLSQVAGATAREPFFDALARFLAENLQMDYVCIDRLLGDGLNASTLAVWHDGNFEDNVTYGLMDTPCGEVVGKNVCCFPGSVRQRFPNDEALQQLEAESYVGVTLWSHSGQPIGLIAVVSRSPLINQSMVESALKQIAFRAAGELERLNADAALKESETRFRTLIESTHEAIAVHRDGKVIYANPSAIKMMGASCEQDLLQKSILDFVAPEFLPVVLNRIKLEAEQGIALPMLEEKFIRLDGTLIDVEVQAAPIQYLGAPATQVAMRDISQQKLAEKNMLLAAGVFTHAREGILITDADGKIMDVNEAFTRITGFSRAQALHQNPSILKSGLQDKVFYASMWRDLHDKGHWNGEIWNRHKDGHVFAEMLTISVVRDAQGRVLQYVGLFSDITALKEHQSQLEHLAHFDVLTNLPNRLLLGDRLQQGLAQADRRGQILAVAYLDLDGFKAINDHHGHDAGDQMLVTLAKRMKLALREADTLARLGGDEFVAVLLDLENTSASIPLLIRLLDAAAQPVQVGELSLTVSASVGVTFYPQAHDLDADQLLRQADQAMYQAKLSGKNRYHVFDAVQDSSLRVHNESLERIQLALDRREFVLYYQPKVNMRTGTIVGAEALIRWQHPERGLLAPGIFLPEIEDHPLAVGIGEWVIDTTLSQIESWRTDGLDIKVSVNIGARQLQQSDFCDRLRIILANHPTLDGSVLELEILETSALEDIGQVASLIEYCAQLGVTFALDDFGTGYSSLTYLKRLQVGMLKIDQSFVRDMLGDLEDLAILQGVIGLATAFRRQVIAEGVETIEHGSLLMQLGCDLAQGYGIARPMPAAELVQWTATWKPDPSWSALPWLGSVD